MSVNAGLAHVSTDFMIAALLIYSLALLAFAGDYAFGRPRRKAMMAAAPVAERAAQLAAVGAASAGAVLEQSEPDTSGADAPGPDATGPAAGVGRPGLAAGPSARPGCR